jgi:FixJ family two-component response regulator
MTKPSSTHGGQPTVLIIDDDPSVLRALARLIRAAGYDVRAFSRPSALLADDNLPTHDACMVVDVNLPEMNGVELCEALVGGGRGLPVIFITGQNDAATKALIERATAVAVLFKPCDESLLFPAISRALKTEGN